MPVEIANLEAVSNALLRVLHRLSNEEQRLGLALHRQLARGRPVPRVSLPETGAVIRVNVPRIGSTTSTLRER